MILPGRVAAHQAAATIPRKTSRYPAAPSYLAAPPAGWVALSEVEPLARTCSGKALTERHSQHGETTHEERTSAFWSSGVHEEDERHHHPGPASSRPLCR